MSQVAGPAYDSAGVYNQGNAAINNAYAQNQLQSQLNAQMRMNQTDNLTNKQVAATQASTQTGMQQNAINFANGVLGQVLPLIGSRYSSYGGGSIGGVASQIPGGPSAQWSGVNTQSIPGVSAPEAVGAGVGFANTITPGPVWNSQQIGQQVNQAKAYNDAATAAQQLSAGRSLAGRGQGYNSPLLSQIDAQLQGQDLAANDASAQGINWNAAQGNAQQLLAGQSAQSQLNEAAGAQAAQNQTNASIANSQYGLAASQANAANALQAALANSQGSLAAQQANQGMYGNQLQALSNMYGSQNQLRSSLLNGLLGMVHITA